MLARTLMLTIAAMLLVVAPGCRWNEWFRRPASDPTPIVFSALPSRDEAVAAVNANTLRVRTLQTQGANVSVPGLPAIGADLALERPLSLRFRAATSWFGPELDLGSNPDMFWFWAARSTPPQVLYARHDRFALSKARDSLPIEPSWLIEALGLVELDPATVSEPVAAGNGRVELRASVMTVQGPATKLIHVHAKHGYVLEQNVIDERGRIRATARLSGHEYFPLDGVSLAKNIEVNVPLAGMQFQLDVTKYVVNAPVPDAQSLFQLPSEQLKQYQFVDVADPNFVPVAAPPAAVYAPVETKPKIETATGEKRYRGFGLFR